MQIPRLCLLSTVTLAGCTAHPLSEPEPRPQTATDMLYEPTAKLDLLFLIDDSRSMAEEQKGLRENFPVFMKALEKLPGGLPDLHVAVVSSDFGAGTLEVDTCRRLGKRGRFQVNPGCGLDEAKARYLATDGKSKNFDGDLAQVFSCLADLGTEGCGYEHQLQSIRAALSTNVNPENAGFLRDDAYLGIIVLSDEDDCSAEPDAPIFDGVYAKQLSDMRCASRGLVCGGREVPVAVFHAPLATCMPYQRGDSAAEKLDRLINVSDFVDYIKWIKGGRLDRIIVSGVFGWSDAPDAEYAIGGDELGVQPICRSANGLAGPGVRLKTFVDAFGTNGSWHSICQAQLESALAGIGQKFVDVLQRRCLLAPPVDIDPARAGVQPDCRVVERLASGRADQGTALPACGGGRIPCWRLQPEAACPFGYRMDVDRNGAGAPAGTVVAVECLTCTQSASGHSDCANGGFTAQ